MSILTDFYNLKLTTHFNNINIDRDGTPDKEIIVRFFEVHAPNVLEFYEYTTAEGEHRTRADTKPNTDPLGTLWMFEQNKGRSWFNGECFNEFYEWHIYLHQMIDSYLTKGIIERGSIKWVNSLAEDLRPELFLVDEDENTYSTSETHSGPRTIKPGEYSFEMALTTIGRYKNNLGLGKFKRGLAAEIQALLNGEIQVRRCEADDCSNIFIPQAAGKPQKYCRRACKVREYRKRKKVMAAV